MPTTNDRPSDDEIEGQILALVAELAPGDNDLVSWRRVRARLPRRGSQREAEALHRLWYRGDLVQIKIGGSPHLALADEISRAADAACARRGEPRTLLVL